MMWVVSLFDIVVGCAGCFFLGFIAAVVAVHPAPPLGFMDEPTGIGAPTKLRS